MLRQLIALGALGRTLSLADACIMAASNALGLFLDDEPESLGYSLLWPSALEPKPARTSLYEVVHLDEGHEDGERDEADASSHEPRQKDPDRPWR